MRLIDLDEFAKLSQNNVADLSSLDEELDINYVWDMGYLECLKVLDSCHVIKAIPIETIKKEIERLKEDIKWAWYYGNTALDKMEYLKMWLEIKLEDWEKENEKENEID